MSFRVWEIIRLSNLSEKHFRVSNHKNKQKGTYDYSNNSYNGAYYLDGKTYLTNGVWFFEINSIINHNKLKMSGKTPTKNVFKEMWKNDLEEVNVDIDKLLPKNNYLALKLGNSYFDSEMLFNEVLNMFKNPSLKINKLEKNQCLQISEDNIRCIVAPLHEVIRGEINGI